MPTACNKGHTPYVFIVCMSQSRHLISYNLLQLLTITQLVNNFPAQIKASMVHHRLHKILSLAPTLVY